MANYQVMPPLTEEEYAALKADIAERGVLVPVEYDENGDILDGYHRVQICQELGIKEWPRVIRVGMSQDQKYEHALKLNIHRRHLSREWKQQKARELRVQGWSYRRIAKVLGVALGTIENWLRESGVQNCTPTAPPLVTGADGKRYPSKRIVPESDEDEVVEEAETKRLPIALCEYISPEIATLVCPSCGYAKWSEKWLRDEDWPESIVCNNCYTEFTYDKGVFIVEGDDEDKEDIEIRTDGEDQCSFDDVPMRPLSIFAATAKAQENVQKVLSSASEGNETAQQLVDKLSSGNTTPRAAIKQVKVDEEKKQARAAIKDIDIGDGKFDVIVIDPPWSYSNRTPGGMLFPVTIMQAKTMTRHLRWRVPVRHLLFPILILPRMVRGVGQR